MTFVIVPDNEKWLVLGAKQRPSSVSVDRYHDLVNLKFKQSKFSIFLPYLCHLFSMYSWWVDTIQSRVGLPGNTWRRPSTALDKPWQTCWPSSHSQVPVSWTKHIRNIFALFRFHAFSSRNFSTKKSYIGQCLPRAGIIVPESIVELKRHALQKRVDAIIDATKWTICDINVTN